MTNQIPLLSSADVREWFAKLPKQDFADQRILLIVPDATRTAPLPLLFDALFREIRPHCQALDVLVALGTHPPLSDQQIAKLLGISETERGRLFYQLRTFNHEWDRPERLLTLVGQ